MNQRGGEEGDPVNPLPVGLALVVMVVEIVSLAATDGTQEFSVGAGREYVTPQTKQSLNQGEEHQMKHKKVDV